jgi:peptidoglycan/LPS O-acetylase OafA/YrhL
MSAGNAVRDDRVLPATRWAALVVFMILVPAVIVLWGTPGETADRWAWAIKPDLMAMFLGAGYGAGAYFFWRTFRAERWHPSSAGVLGAAVFATVMLAATLIHWERFNHGDAPFLAAFALWLRNRATDSGQPDPGEPLLAPGVLLAARAFGLVTLTAAMIFFVFPDTAIDVWPWQLTPLTSRVLASFMAQVATGALVLSTDRRWSAWRLIVETFFVATALLLIGAARGWSDFDEGDLTTYAYIGGLSIACAALLVLYVRTERRALV